MSVSREELDLGPPTRVNYATFDEFKCAIICLPAGKHHLNEGCMRRRDFLGLTASVTAAWPFTALAQSQSKFRHVGPVPSDTVFVKLRASQYDAVVAMYHDQGHIRVKLFGFEVDPATGRW